MKLTLKLTFFLFALSAMIHADAQSSVYSGLCHANDASAVVRMRLYSAETNADVGISLLAAQTTDSVICAGEPLVYDPIRASWDFPFAVDPFDCISPKFIQPCSST